MKPIAIFFVVAIVSLGIVAASHAKTVTSTGKTTNEQSVVGVAGPAPAGNKPKMDTTSTQSSKSTLKKSKVKAPPPMHDPN